MNATTIEVRQTPAFEKWLRSLRDRVARQRVADRLLRLEAGQFGDHKPINATIGELRFHFGPGYRVYYARHVDGTIVIILGGGDKGSQARDIERATRLAERELAA